jgi:catechol 2,3-dioxygenase-like lactoylglutathione lyase family enzyme
MTSQLRLNGVHHTARPTWKLRETIEFYRDKMGLPLVHCVSARGWGAAEHPDFLHFFFDSGAGSTIAFFYYLGEAQPDHLVHRPQYNNDAIHTAWRVETREELLAWRKELESQGVEIMYQIEHEVVESIYFRDPNGYYLEIGRPVREFIPLDETDSAATLDAALAVEAQRNANNRLKDIESVWRAKGEQLHKLLDGGDGICIYVADFPEFKPFIDGASSTGNCEILSPEQGYWRIKSEREIRLVRKSIGLGPALWNSALAGGFRGRIAEYGRDSMRIVAGDQPRNRG